MLPPLRLPPLRLFLLSLIGLPLILSVSCAGSSLETSLQADPRLQDQGRFTETETPSDDGAATSAEPGTKPEPGATSPPPQDGVAIAPNPDQPDFIGPRPPADWVGAAPSPSPSPDLADIPEDLQPYVQDWLALDLKTTAPGSPSWQPNQGISRGAYAEWLLATNNRFYDDQPQKRIRSGQASAKPAFQDVPPSHPQYGAIQGLAEAGIIPSPLSGSSTTVSFRPDAPLTRETLVLWKVPLDTRAVLPGATVEAVKTAWGFQDAATVEPLALRAVLADHQSGEFANILRAFGYTTLFQPKKAVTQAEAIATLWRFGNPTEGISAQDLLKQ